MREFSFKTNQSETNMFSHQIINLSQTEKPKVESVNADLPNSESDPFGKLSKVAKTTLFSFNKLPRKICVNF